MTYTNLIKTGLCLASAVMFTACASTPDPVDTMPIATGGPAMGPSEPVFVAPAPVRPIPQVVENTLPDAETSSSDSSAFSSLPIGPNPGSVDEFVQNVGDRVFFGYNQYSLSSEARNLLRTQAQWLGNYPSTIAVIGGHADERGTREYNLALGARRADAVKGFLVSQGVDPARITTVSYGKERPIDGRSNEQAWSMNRNSHTAIVSGSNS